MIICLSGFVIAGASPAPLSSALLRAADCSTSVPPMPHLTPLSSLAGSTGLGPGLSGSTGLGPGLSGSTGPAGLGLGSTGLTGLGPAGARYSPHHQQLLQHFAPPPPALLALRGATRSSSSSAESVSSSSASPPPPGAGAGGTPAPLHARLYTHPYRRVRTLYACLGESDGELSFEPNQIITNVTASAEPGWLRGTLNGKSGLVPENYVEPLP